MTKPKEGAWVQVRLFVADARLLAARKAVEAVLGPLDWRYPDYGYRRAPLAPTEESHTPLSSTVGGETSKNRSVATKGGAAISVASASDPAAEWAACRLKDIVAWRAAVPGMRADRKRLRVYGVIKETALEPGHG